MTTETPTPVKGTLLSGMGHDEVLAALESIYERGVSVDRFSKKLGLRGLTWLIATVLDEHYPEVVFPADVLHPTWGGEHGGDDIDPGVKWVALLRQAIKEVQPREE